MDEKEIKFIQDQIGYTFKHQELLVQAFTRRSYSMEKGGQDNEVLEFIGDKALDFVVVKQLSEEFGHYSKKYQNWEKWGKTEETGTFISDLDEGELTEIKKQLVQKNTLADAIDNLGIAYYLIMGKGDVEKNIQDSLSVKEDLFEAILGAIALDSNWDIEALQDSMNVMLNPGELMFDEDVNYVAEIQAWSSANSGNIPLHCFYPTSMQGAWYMPRHHMCIYGKAEQDTHFACEVQIPGIDYHFVGYGRSKNLARMDASRLAYEYLKDEDMLFSIRDEIDDPNYNDSIGQLEILARRGYFSIPQYDFKETHDEDGNPVWNCKCSIKEKDTVTNGRSSSKKDAKKQAAYDMLTFVLEEE